MRLKNLQKTKEKFDRKRGWHRSAAPTVFVHFIEESGEIGRHILFEDGYKKEEDGHKKGGELKREFAQALLLFVQLANHFGIDLEKAVTDELRLMEKRFPAATLSAPARTTSSSGKRRQTR